MKRYMAFVAMLLGALAMPGHGIPHSDMGCDLCHTPHHAETLPGVPLWNGTATTTTFTMYSSDTFQGTIDGQPSGSSRLCLGCHDGANPNFLWMSDETTFGASELATSHPISFVYDSALATLDGGLKDPAEPSTLGGTILLDLLDGESKLQCTSCHDIHSSGIGKSMLKGYNYGFEEVQASDGSIINVHHGSELCRMCHMK